MSGMIWQAVLNMIRNPATLLSMCALTVLFAGIAGLEDMEGTSAYVSETLSKEALQQKIVALNAESEDVNFKTVSDSELENIVTRQSVDAFFMIGETDYEVHLLRNESLVAMTAVPVLDQFYTRNNVDDEVVERLEETEDAFSMNVTMLGSSNAEPFNHTVKNMFGMALFFVIYTISFAVSDILKLRERFIWDRIIMSPTSKVSMYFSYFFIAFVVGYVQVMLALTIFYTVFDFPFFDGFWKTWIAIIPYVFAVMAIGIFLSSIVKSMAQLSGYIMMFAMGSAMLGGAFWPLHITGDFLYALSYLSPLKYGMDLLYGSTLYSWEWAEFLLPASILFFIGCTFTALGVHNMESRAER